MSSNQVAQLDRVLTRLANTSAEKLPDVLDKLLPLLVDTLADPVARPKVLQVLKHINTRVNEDHSVQLPCSRLVQVFQNPDSNPFSKNFALIYLEMGFSRLSGQRQADLLPDLLVGVASLTASQSAIVMRLVLDSLVQYMAQSLPVDKSERAAPFLRTLDSLADVSFVLDYFLDVLLLTGSSSAQHAAGKVVYGLSASRITRLTNPKTKTTPTSTTLADYQLSILKFLMLEILPEHKIVPHLVCGSLTQRHDSVALGENGLKRLHQVDYEDDGFVQTMYDLLLGSSDRAPVDVRHKMALLKQFTKKSKLAVRRQQVALRLAFEFLFQTHNNQVDRKHGLRIATMQFVRWFIACVMEQPDLPLATAQALLKALLAAIAQQQAQIKNAEKDSEFDKLLASDGERTSKPASAPTGAPTTRDDPGFLQVRGLTFAAIGELSRCRCAELFIADLSVVNVLVRALEEEHVQVKPTVLTALSYIALRFESESSSIPASLMSNIEEVLVRQAASSVFQCRLFASEWAQKLFPFNNPAARFICLVLANDDTLAVRQSAARGLIPGVFGFTTKAQAAGSQFTSTTATLQTQSPTNVDLVWVDGDDPDHDAIMNPEHAALFPAFHDFFRFAKDHCEFLGNTTTPEPLQKRPKSASLSYRLLPASQASVVSFACGCLIQNANTSPAEGAATGPSQLARLLREQSTNEAWRGAFDQFVRLLEASLSVDVTDYPDAKKCQIASLHCLYVLAMANPSSFIGTFMDDPKWLLRWIQADTPVMRELAAQFAGFFPVWQSSQDVSKFANELQECLSSGTLDIQGIVLALGYLVEAIHKKTVQGDRMDDEWIRNATVALAKLVLTPSIPLHLSCATVKALGLVGRARALDLPLGEPVAGNGVQAAEDAAPTQFRVVDKLARLARQPEDSTIALRNKQIQFAVRALGELACGADSPSLREATLEGLFAVGKNKYDDIQFDVGVGLVSIAKGPWLPNNPDASNADQVSLQENPAAYLFQTMLTTHLNSTNNRIRAAVVIWMVCMVSEFATSPYVQRNALVIQDAFGRLLAEKGEVTQECAAKGIAYLYENCKDVATKSKLVTALVRQLTIGVREQSALQAVREEPDSTRSANSSSSQTSTSVATGDGQQEHSGASAATEALPLRPANKTYKEMCDVASNVGKQDLVYVFLALSSHHGIWNTKRGVSFDLSVVVTPERMKALEPFIPKLLPVLFRYQYDSNPGIKSSMSKLFRLLIPSDDEKHVIDTNFKVLVVEMLECMNSVKYRERHSAALAMVDLVRGRQANELLPHLDLLWIRTLRLFDDANDLARAAANTLMLRLIRLSVRFCSVSDSETYTARNGAEIEQAMAIVVPILLEKGVVNMSAETRAVSMYSLVKVIKGSGAYVRPYTPELLDMLLQSLGSFEDGRLINAMSHTSDRGGRLNMTSDELEKVRVDAARDSMMQDAITVCLGQVRREPVTVLHDIAARLAHLLRRGIGLPTLTATARAVYELVESKHLQATTLEGDGGQSRHALYAHSEKLLRSLASGLKNSSPTIQRAYAVGAARLARVSKPTAVETYVAAMVNLYTENNEREAIRQSVGFAVKELVDILPPDMVNGAKDKLVPLIFLARYDEIKETAQVWSDLWTSSFGTVERGAKEHLDILMDHILVSLTSTSWLTKRQAALGLIQVVDALGEGFPAKYSNAILDRIVDALPGRLWTGKEHLITAIYTVKKHHPSAGKSMEELISVMIGECDRSDKDYRRVAYQRLGSLCELVPVEDTSMDASFKLASDKCMAAIAKQMELVNSNDSEEAQTGAVDNVILARAIECMGAAFPHVPDAQAAYLESVIKVYEEAIVGTPWVVQASVVKSLGLSFSRVANASVLVAAPAGLSCAFGVLYKCLVQNKKPRVLLATLDAVISTAAKFRELHVYQEDVGSEISRELDADLVPKMKALLSHKDVQVASRAALAVKSCRELVQLVTEQSAGDC